MVTYAEAARLLGNAFGGTPTTAPAKWKVGLSTTPLNLDGSGVTEPSGGAYARVEIANNTATFTSPVNGEVFNSVDIEFPLSTAPWGTVTHIFFADADGIVRYYDQLKKPRTIEEDSIVKFPANTIKVSLKPPVLSA